MKTDGKDSPIFLEKMLEALTKHRRQKNNHDGEKREMGNLALLS
jgi:hypothetical protein